MMSPRIISVLALQSLLISEAKSSFRADLFFRSLGVDSCPSQNSCIDWTFDSNVRTNCDNPDDDCEWTVCLTLNFSKDGCTKSGSISHSCPKPEDKCNVPADEFPGVVNSDSDPKGLLSDGGKQCQTGKAGTVVSFVLKDGSRCEQTVELKDDKAFIPEKGAIVCAVSEDLTCTGQGNKGTECLWTVTLPNCPKPSAAPSLSARPSNKPSETPSVTVMPSPMPSDTPSVTVMPSRTPSNIPSVTVMPSPTPSDTPSVTVMPSPTPSDIPSVTVMPSPTPSDIPSVTIMPTPKPTENPTLSPKPTPKPTENPTLSPKPTPKPTENPTLSPKPTTKPTENPTLSPKPTSKPTENPTLSSKPTPNPTSRPVMIEPTAAPQPEDKDEFPSMLPTLPPSDKFCVCPTGDGICYTEDCCCSQGKCTPEVGKNLADVLVNYDGKAGSYKVRGTCESGKDLSNAVKIGKFCVKEEPSGEIPEFEVDIGENGTVLTPFSMKCGTKCFTYGDSPITCNAVNVGLKIASLLDRISKEKIDGEDKIGNMAVSLFPKETMMENIQDLKLTNVKESNGNEIDWIYLLTNEGNDNNKEMSNPSKKKGVSDAKVAQEVKDTSKEDFLGM